MSASVTGELPSLNHDARGRFPAGAEEGSRDIAGLAGRVADGTKKIRAVGTARYGVRLRACKPEMGCFAPNTTFAM